MLRIALINPFPRFRNAEREYIERFVRVAAAQGHEAWRVTPEGRVMTAEGEVTDEVIDPARFDFAVALHHATAKQLDLFTYGVLWVPIRDDPPQYGENMRRMLSWDDRLSSDSPIINGFVANAAWGVGLDDPLNPLVASITCQRTDLAPRRRESPRLFYAGTNWDLGQNTTEGRGRIRHEALLRALDGTGKADFYGPRYDPATDRTGWEGFSAYRGELPFDGVSTLRRISEAGVCLALTSRRHRRDAVASVRVFEACAAGAVVITDHHPFFRQAFGDSLIYVDSDGPPEVLRDQVLAALDVLERDPDAALQRAVASQRIFHERFTLDRFVEQLCAQHPARLAALRPPRTAARVGVIVPATGAAQLPPPPPQADVELELAVVDAPGEGAASAATRGALVAEGAARLDADILCLLPPGARLTRAAVATLAGALLEQDLDAVAPPRPHPAGAGEDRRVDYDFAVPPEHFAWPFVLADWGAGLVFRRRLLERLPQPPAAWDGDIAGALIQAAQAGAGFRVVPVVARLPADQAPSPRRRARRTPRLAPVQRPPAPLPPVSSAGPASVLALDGDAGAAAAQAAGELAGAASGLVAICPALTPRTPDLAPGLAAAWSGAELVLRRDALAGYPVEALAVSGGALLPALDAVLRRQGPVAGRPPAELVAAMDPWEGRFVADVARPQAAPLTTRRGVVGYAAAWANMPHRRELPAIRLARRVWGAVVRLGGAGGG